MLPDPDVKVWWKDGADQEENGSKLTGKTLKSKKVFSPFCAPTKQFRGIRVMRNALL
jgi:hypothetical protein